MLLPCRGIDVVLNDVAVVGKLFIADGTLTVLDHDLLVQQLPHFHIRSNLPISSRMVVIVDPADSQLALASFSRDRFPAAPELREVNRAQLITAESHSFLQFRFGGINADLR